MTITKIALENFTAFAHVQIPFSPGINVFIGENGTGKTHVMKVLYSACQAVRIDVSFSQKLVKVFKPDQLKISRLTRRGRGKKPFRYIYRLECAAAGSTERLRIRAKIGAKLPFELQKEPEFSKKMIENFEILSIEEWNHHPVYGQFPIIAVGG